MYDVCSVCKILSICDRQYDLQSDGRVPGAMDNLQSHTRGGAHASPCCLLRVRILASLPLHAYIRLRLKPCMALRAMKDLKTLKDLGSVCSLQSKSLATSK